MSYSYLFYQKFPEGIKTICIGGHVFTKEEFLQKQKEFLNSKKKKNVSSKIQPT